MDSNTAAVSSTPKKAVAANMEDGFLPGISPPFPTVHVLYPGYSQLVDGVMTANCSCVLIKSQAANVIVDTMTAWDKDKILAGLWEQQLTPDDITDVVCTHGHSDHVGNLNMFTRARHVVGFTVHRGDVFHLHPFECGDSLNITPHISVLPTPGHTAEHVSVAVTTGEDGECVVVAGDLFEKEEDILQPSLWQEAGSEDPVKQKTHRAAVADLAKYIVPGHGPMFLVTEEHRRLLKEQLKN